MDLKLIEKSTHSFDEKFFLSNEGLLVEGVNSDIEKAYYMDLYMYELRHDDKVFEFTIENVFMILNNEESRFTIGVIKDYKNQIDEQLQEEILNFLNNQIQEQAIELFEDSFSLIIQVEEDYENDNNRVIKIY